MFSTMPLRLVAAFAACLAPFSIVAAELVGTLPGRFAVSQTGAATYQIPIDAPTASGGLRPSVSFSYNHRGGTGIAGQGWTVDGLSAITRCPQTIAQDGQRRGVKLDLQDKYCLDGQRLVAVSGAYGAAGTEYRTEIESFKKIVSSGTAGNGPQLFIVTDRDGTRHYYGHQLQSSLIDSSTGTYRNWARYYVRDRFSNDMIFSYATDQTIGEQLLSYIAYTRNDLQSLAPRYRVNFYYEDRPNRDQRSGYQFGTLWSRTKRLQRVSVLNLSTSSVWETVHEYTLSYQLGSTFRSQLTGIKKCRGPNCLPETTFNWQDATAGWDPQVSSGQSSSGHSDPLPGDFNADGQQDLFVVKNGEWHVLTAAGSSLAAPIDTNMSADNPSYTLPFDFNGDAKTDLLVPGNDGFWHVYQSTGTGFTDINTGEPTTGYTQSYAEDVDGDGRGDLIYKDGPSLYLRKSTGTDLESTATLVYTHHQMPEFLKIKGRPDYSANRQVDFNGDGMGDIMILEREIEVDEYGSSTFYIWSALVFNGSTFDDFGTIGSSSEARPHIVDINGDGLNDIAFTIGSSWYMQLSVGSGLAAWTNLNIQDSNHWSAVFADYNADGLDDLIRATSTSWLAHESTGTRFSTLGASVGGPTPLSSPAIPLDVSGSGYDELAMSHAGYWQVRDHKSELADVVVSFIDGLGNTNGIVYAATPQANHYYETSSLAVNFPTQRHTTPISIVDSADTTDGTGGSYTIDYKYWDALRDTQGRGSLGFRVLRAIDQRDGTYRQRHYHQDWPYIALLNVAYHVQSESGGPTIRMNNPNYGQTTLGSGQSQRIFRRMETRSIKDYEVGGTLDGQQIRSVVDDPVYDTSYGNVTSRTITSSSPQRPGESFTTTLNYTYTNLTSPWCIGLPTQVVATRSATGVTSETRQVTNTFDTTKCRLLTTTDTSIADQDLQLRTTITYDGYGNIKTVIGDSANGTAADRKTEFFYDTWGHLPLSQRFYVDGSTDPEPSSTWDYKTIVPLSATDAGGRTTTWQYDDFGRRTSESRPNGTSSTWSYVDCIDCVIAGSGRFRIIRLDSDGFVSADYRDRFNRRIALSLDLPTGAQSWRAIHRYDAHGRLSFDYVPRVIGEPGYYRTFSYDLIDRLTQINAPISETQTLGAKTLFSYEGLTTRSIDAENESTYFDRDALGRLVKVTDALGGETDYAYSPFDQLIKVWDPADNLTTIGYNDRGDRTSISEPNSGTSTYELNVFGEQTLATDANGQTSTSTYNQLGLPTSRIELEGTTTWNYFTTSDHKLWLPSSVTAPGGFAENYSYDTLGRPASISTTLDGTAYVTDFAYHTSGSGKGKLHRITYPASSGSRFKVDYEYDTNGLLTRVEDGDSPSTVYYELFETDGYGRERLATLGNGISEDRVYDNATGRLKQILTGPNLTSTVQNLSFEWDKVGTLTEREDLNQLTTEVLGYDRLYRLKSAARNGVNTLNVNYDSTGNITYKSDVGTYTYGAGTAGPNAVTGVTGLRPGTYTYDANGNMITRAGDSLTWYSYDLPKRINYGSDYADFQYGPDRARFKQVALTGSATTTTYYVGGHFEKEIGGGTTTYRHHIRAGGRTIAVHTRPSSGPNKTEYLHRDHLGSVVAVTNQSGTLVQEYSFDAYGKRRNTDWTADTADTQFGVSHLTDRGYTGHEHLDNTRLVHMNGRAQDPILGRMLSADPIVPNPFNGQAFNRYSYVYNNPSSLTDMSGFGPDDPEPDCEGVECVILPPLVRPQPDPNITERDITTLDDYEEARDTYCSQNGGDPCSGYPDFLTPERDESGGFFDGVGDIFGRLGQAIIDLDRGSHDEYMATLIEISCQTGCVDIPLDLSVEYLSQYPVVFGNFGRVFRAEGAAGRVGYGAAGRVGYTGSLRFRNGDIILREFRTSRGTVDLAAEVQISGRSLHLKDVAVFPRGTDRLSVGAREVIAIRNQLAQEARAYGFRELRITGTRVSGANPGKQVDILIDLMQR